MSVPAKASCRACLSSLVAFMQPSYGTLPPPPAMAGEGLSLAYIHRPLPAALMLFPPFAFSMSGEVFIGAGGWGYFAGGLAAYVKAFQFTEVNTTFYRLPRLSDVDRWRRTVPATFVFSVKAPRQITHRGGRLDGPEARERLGQTATICNRLRSPWLVLVYPPWREFDDASCAALADLLSSAGMDATVCLEARAYRARDLPPKLAETMEDNAIVDVVDPLVQEPRVASEHAYVRVFGKGEHNVYQPTDEELEDVDDRTSGGEFKSMVFAFHGVRMYKDAARFTTFKQTGRFPKVTRGEGLASLDEILREDAVFPSSKERLVQHQGWKLFDLAENKRVRASLLLRQLEDGMYRSRAEVIAALGPFPPSKA